MGVSWGLDWCVGNGGTGHHGLGRRGRGLARIEMEEKDGEGRTQEAGVIPRHKAGVDEADGAGT